ncbi:MAG: hypothetical protein ACK4S4_03130 [Pyrinomonadaceae bacterium]
MKKLFLPALLTTIALSAAAYAQPRPAERSTTPAGQSASSAPAPATFAAKYEGGMFGYSEKLKGTLKFDDANERLVFIGEDQKELFAFPYRSVLVIYPQSRSVRSTTGTVVSAVPLPGAGLAGLIREKRRYMVMQFSDPDADVRGVVNFKFENKELLDQAIRALGEKSGLQQRGDAYYRPRTPAKPAI